MYLIVIAWLYVALMMAVAEATNTTGTLLGALITFVLYGVLPVALVVYLMGTPARRKAHQGARSAEAAERRRQAAVSQMQAARCRRPKPAADAVAPVRKEP